MRMLAGIAVLLFFTLSRGLAAPGEAPSVADVAPAQVAAPNGGDFTLQSLKGPISTKDFRGKLVMLYFGYTQCPDVCPTSLSLMTQSLNELTPKELEQVVGIFVSVDPQRDSVASLAEYVGYFHPNFVGTTGSAEAVAEAAKLYGAQYSFSTEGDSALGYTVNHSATIYLIDKQGVLRFTFPHETPPETMLGAMRFLFEEQ